MSVQLVAIVRDEAETLPRTLPTYFGLIDSWTILDTGSVDDTADVVRDVMQDIPGELFHTDWSDFSTARNEALALAAERSRDDWLLMTDADFACEIHAGLRGWLAEDTCPEVDAWMVEIMDSGTRWHRPLLLRGGQEWEYLQPVHEFLNTSGRYTRNLLGLTLHHASEPANPDKYLGYADMLRPLAGVGDPRATFYLAESLRFAGHIGEAVEAYKTRAAMEVGFDEEGWYAAYMAAKLEQDVGALLEVWEMRPWRHEPLTAAARIVAQTGGDRDLLFLEPSP